VQTPVVELVTDVVPSPLVMTVGVKEPPNVPELGRFDTDGVVGVVREMVKLCVDPSAAT
jgi:hypothetical protein